MTQKREENNILNKLAFVTATKGTKKRIIN